MPARFDLMNTSLGKLADSTTMERVVKALLAYEPEEIILFGSAARDDADEYSDLDLIVVKNTQTRFMERLSEVNQHLPAGKAVDAFVYTPLELRTMVEEDNPFIEQALIDGKLLYERSPGKGPWQGIAASYTTSKKAGSPVKKPMETARRWLAQAEYSLNMARALLKDGFWSGACFQSEQTAQMALKAFLFKLGRRSVTIHSVRELAQTCSQEDDGFTPFVDYGGVLDRYYLSTRYPDALPAPAIPFQSFTRRDGEQAVGFAEEIVRFVQAKVLADAGGPAK